MNDLGPATIKFNSDKLGTVEPPRQIKLPTLEGLYDRGDSIEILGVQLPKWQFSELVLKDPELLRRMQAEIPQPEEFESHTSSITPFDLREMRDAAVAIDLGLPLLTEGGTGIGKSSGYRRLCMYLQAPCFDVNCHKMGIDELIGIRTFESDSSVIFVPGALLLPAIYGGHALLNEYNFPSGEVRGGLHHFVDAKLDGRRWIRVLQNKGELYQFDQNFNLGATQNAPGGDTFDRETLDAAQFCRFVYKKRPDQLTDEQMRARAFMPLRAYRPETNAAITEADFLHTSQQQTLEQLRAMPEMIAMMGQFIEFYQGFRGLLSKTIAQAENAPQPIFLDFQRSLNRVERFMTRYYNGDLGVTMRRALSYFFTGMLGAEADRQKSEQLILTVQTPRRDDQWINENAYYRWQNAKRPNNDQSRLEFLHEAEVDYFSTGWKAKKAP